MPITSSGLATSFITFSRPGASGGGATTTLSNGRIGWAGHNLLLSSESFDNANWNKGSFATVAANVEVAPNGTTTADTITTSNVGHAVSQNVSVTAGAVYTFAFWAKRGTMTDAKYSVFDNTNAANIVAPTSYYSTISASAWTLVTVSFTAPAGCTQVAVYPLRDSGVTGTIHLWGAYCHRADLGGMQLNPAQPAGMQSYYPTTPRNMVGYSEDLSDAYWVKTGLLAFGSGSIFNAIVGPNGLQTADFIVPSTGVVAHTLRTTTRTATATSYTASVYAKAGGYNFLGVQYVTDGYSKYYEGVFNLATGVVESTGRAVSYTGSRSITPVGDGWYRCSITVTLSDANVTSFVGFVVQQNNDPTTSFAGDGTSGIYLWGAQFSDSASLDTYVPVYGAAVTSAAYYAPRLDFDGATLSPKGLLVEELRTNLACFTEASASTLGTAAGTTPPSISATTLSGVSVEAITFSTGGSGYNFSRREGANTSISGGWSATSGTSYICSAYIALSRPLTGSEAIEVYQTGTQGGASIVLNASTTNQTTLQRYSASITMSASGTQGTYVFVNSALSSSITVYITRFQAEAGSFATSYIPNGSAVAGATRAADVASVSTGAFPYSGSEGTLVASGSFIGGTSLGQGGRTLVTLQSDANNRLWIDNGFNSVRGYVLASGNEQASLTSSSAGDSVVLKAGLAFAANNFAFSKDGAAVSTDTTGIVPSANEMRLGNLIGVNFLSGHIRQITYIPRRISNAELQSRTA